MRMVGLDVLRGYAVLLMVLDHTLGVVGSVGLGGPVAYWLRHTLTRAALPLFMGVAGYLWSVRGVPSFRRRRALLWASLVSTVLAAVIGIGLPEILGVYWLVLFAAPIALRFPASVVGVGIVQAFYVPIFAGRAYEPGLVLAFCSVGVLASRACLPGRSPTDSARCASFCRGPISRIAETCGKNPLLIYVGHLAALAFVVVIARA